MKYTYQARSKEGKLETGTVEASSREAAALLLQKYDIFVTSIKEESSTISKLGNIHLFEKVSKKDLAIFSRQLAVMMQSRVPIVQSLRSLALQTKKQTFKEKILKASQLVEEGNPLSEAFSAFPEVFSVFYISLIKTGEASGKISDTLYYLSDHLERESDIGAKLKSAMIYPAFVIVVLVVVLGIVMFFVMPRIAQLLAETTADPPMMTKIMLAFYDFLAHYGWILIVGFVVMVISIIYYFSTKEGKKTYDKMVLKLPFIKEFMKKIYLVRFAENISTLIGAGLSINNALNITKDTVENFVYKGIIAETEERVSQGERISAVLVKYSEYVPQFVVQMIQVGEETGKLDKNLMEIVNFYQKEINRAIEVFTALLEPILIIFLGIIVALMAITVLEPLYGALSTL
jgi:type IV pilus assembly protein PilC